MGAVMLVPLCTVCATLLQYTICPPASSDKLSGTCFLGCHGKAGGSTDSWMKKDGKRGIDKERERQWERERDRKRERERETERDRERKREGERIQHKLIPWSIIPLPLPSKTLINYCFTISNVLTLTMTLFHHKHLLHHQLNYYSLSLSQPNLHSLS